MLSMSDSKLKMKKDTVTSWDSRRDIDDKCVSIPDSRRDIDDTCVSIPDSRVPCCICLTTILDTPPKSHPDV